MNSLTSLTIKIVHILKRCRERQGSQIWSEFSSGKVQGLDFVPLPNACSDTHRCGQGFLCPELEPLGAVGNSKSMFSPRFPSDSHALPPFVLDIGICPSARLWTPWPLHPSRTRAGQFVQIQYTGRASSAVSCVSARTSASSGRFWVFLSVT